MTAPLLIIEGATSLCLVYRSILERAGNTVRCASSLSEGMALFHDAPPSVVIVDGTLSGTEHQAALRHFQKAHQSTKVLLTVPKTLLQHRTGALDSAVFDILVKPFDEMRLLSAVADARAEVLRERLERSGITKDDIPMALMGDSPAIVQLRERLAAFAGSTAPVMVTGQGGTGKSDCARLLHNSRNTIKDSKLIEITCNGIAPATLASEFGAATAKDTVLLHDLQDLPQETSQLLLQQLKSNSIEVRAIISTVNGTVSDLLARSGQSADLIHRLNALPLNLPALHQRQADLCRIAEIALPELCAVEGRSPMTLSAEAEARLLCHDWPGNIPELINVLRQILVLFADPVITADMVDQVLETSASGVDAAAPSLMGQTLADIERAVIEQTIKHHDGSVPKAAKSLGVSPSTLYRKRESWGADA